jgi:hypothetical protein
LRVLYFDLDGTLIGQDTGRPKAALLDGRFEDAVRAAAFDSIVCVGSFVGVIHEMAGVRADYDGPGAILDLCGGTFRDEAWFRRTLGLVRDPWNRAAEIPLDSDWWYVDDLARAFCSRAGREDVFRSECGRRICVPQPDGDGSDVLEWLFRSTQPAGPP